MKTSLNMIKPVILIGIALLLANCSKDSDPSPSDNLIIGNWKFSTVDVTLKVGSQSFVDYLIDQGLTPEDAQLFESEFASDFEDVDGTIDIKKGGTYSTTNGGSTDTGTWALSSDGKTLTLDKGTSDEFVFTVKTLTATNLNLSGDQIDDSGGDTLTIHLEIALTK